MDGKSSKWSKVESPTAQAAENNSSRWAEESKQRELKWMDEDISRIDDILNSLNDMNSSHSDLITVVGVLGSLQARIKRELHIKAKGN